jgi:hypothetical protein
LVRHRSIPKEANPLTGTHTYPLHKKSVILSEDEAAIQKTTSA